jgi:hypothetical protein
VRSLLQQLALGEGSRRQFKRNATNADALAVELAFLFQGCRVSPG